LLSIPAIDLPRVSRLELQYVVSRRSVRLHAPGQPPRAHQPDGPRNGRQVSLVLAARLGPTRDAARSGTMGRPATSVFGDGAVLQAAPGDTERGTCCILLVARRVISAGRIALLRARERVLGAHREFHPKRFTGAARRAERSPAA